MITKLLPVLLAAIGTSGGIGAGLALRPQAPDQPGIPPCGDIADAAAPADMDADRGDAAADAELDYIELNKQFIVPVVTEDTVNALVIMSLGVAVSEGEKDNVLKSEPKLRDALLQVLFDHANTGGFRGRFTDGTKLDVLRVALTEAAQSVVGDGIGGVIITSIARQEV